MKLYEFVYKTDGVISESEIDNPTFELLRKKLGEMLTAEEVRENEILVSSYIPVDKDPEELGKELNYMIEREYGVKRYGTVAILTPKEGAEIGFLYKSM